MAKNFKYQISAAVKLVGIAKPDEGKTQVEHIDVQLFEPPGTEGMRNDEGMPNADGVKMMTELFIQGLVACIRTAEHHGHVNGPDEIKRVIGVMGEAYAAVSDVEKGMWDKR